ncbi:protein kinase domain-containing protein [Pantoea stewartii]|uniref:protein kinase domain-containing protein n=1 Tax=Pantoea stewartii TaxID=66269 RepID=UPI00138FE2FE|nr:protein kinase [Pantoea stewartii]
MENYKITSEGHLGSGTYGSVEKIQLTNLLGNQCHPVGYAMKTLINVQNDPDLIKRFIRELKSQDACLHKHVVQIFLCNLSANPPWFVMELAECSLYKELQSVELSITKKINIINMVLKGVAYIHSKGYLHRDIKPENILRFPGEIYKVTDFGFAKHSDPSNSQFATKVGLFHGTPKYFDWDVMANGYSNQSDIYSLGVLLEDLYFDGLDEIIAKCKHKKLNKRFYNVEQILNAVNALEVKKK